MDESVSLYCHTVGPLPAALAPRYRSMLSVEECSRIDRFHFSRDRDYRLVARAMVRCILSSEAGVNPSDWEFRLNTYGRPEIAAPAEFQDLRFSVSHARPLCACLVGWRRVLGIDLEPLNDVQAIDSIATWYFAPSEIRMLQALPDQKKRTRFLELWTLKEAYLKARGVGLQVPLSEVWFDLQDGASGPTRVSFGAQLLDDPKMWQFTFEALSQNHIVATAVRLGGSNRVKIAHLDAARSLEKFS